MIEINKKELMKLGKEAISTAKSVEKSVIPEPTKESEQILQNTLLAQSSQAQAGIKISKISTKTENILTNKEISESLQKQTISDFLGETKARFSKEEIDKLIPLYKKEPEIFNKLVNEKIMDWSEIEKPRFSTDDIGTLINLSSKDKKFFNTLIAEKSATIFSKGEAVPRFETNDIQLLMSIPKKNRPRVVELLKETQIDRRYEIAKYSASNILKILKLEKQNPERTKELLSLKMFGENPRFSVNEVEKIMTLEKEDKAGVERFLNMKTNLYKTPEPRFNADDIEKLVSLSKEDKKSVDFLLRQKTPSSDPFRKKMNPRFKADDIQSLLEATKNHKEILKPLVASTLKDSVTGIEIPRFNSYDISNLMTSINSDKELVKFLAKGETQYLNGKKVPILNNPNIYNIIDVYKNDSNVIKDLYKNKDLHFFLNIISPENYKLLKDTTILRELISSIPKKPNKAFFNTNKYIDNTFQFCIGEGNSYKIFDIGLKDNKPAILSKETVKNISSTQKRIHKEFADGQSQTQELNYWINGEGNQYLKNQKKTLFDNNGVQIHSEVVAPSKENPKVYTINTYERGLNKPMEKKPIGTIKMYGSKKQGSKISRFITSPDGTTEEHVIISGPKGSGMKYEIKDKDKNILFSDKRQFNKIDDNHFTSSLNGQKYDMKFNSGKITVSKLDNNGKGLETITLDDKLLDPQLTDLYKKLPGDYFFSIKEMKLKVYLNKDASRKNNAGFCEADNAIDISEELKDNAFVFAHELGHAKDYLLLKNLNQDKNLKEIFNKELTSYKSTTSDTEGHSIDYFTTKKHINTGGCLTEVIAETNALTSGLSNDNYEQIMMRSVVLQQHFSKTISYIASILEKSV